MSFLRLDIRLAVKEPIPQELKDALPSIKDKIRQLKSFASKINEGTNSEEMTVKATWHRCFHDEGKPCGEEQEV